MNTSTNIASDTSKIPIQNSETIETPQIITSALAPNSDSKKDNTILEKNQKQLIENAKEPIKDEKNRTFNTEDKILEQKKVEIDSKNKNKSQLTRNSINAPPKEMKYLSTTNKSNIIKINFVLSQNKNKRKTEYQRADNKNIFNILKNEDKTENKSELNNDITDDDDRKKRYVSLIKKLAFQLKRKVRPPSKGYFYVSIIRTDKYLSKVKNIAKKMKNQISLPTHGFFYTFLEKEKKYKSLVKKIAYQLKKRIKFPTCKIIKIYESYRLLVKKIANSIKNSMKKKEKEDKSSSIILENNSNTSPIIIENITSNDPLTIENGFTDTVINVEINKNKNEVLNNEDIKKRSEENVDDLLMDIEEDNLNKNNYCKEKCIQNEFNSLKYSKTDALLSKRKNGNEHGNESDSKMDIIQEEIPKSYEIKKRPVLIFNNIEIDENNDKIETEEIDQLKNVEHNQKEPTLPIMEKILHTNFLESEISKEINVEEKNNEIKSDDKINEEEKEKEIIQNEISEKINCSKNGKSISYSSKKDKNKKIQLNISVFKKEYFKESKERKIQNKSHTRNDINLNLNKLDNLNKNEDEENNKKISLSEIEIIDPEFSKKFHKFLIQENIEIKNNFPIGLNDDSIIYFHQSHFWYLILCYIFNQNNNLSLYSIIHLLELYNIWSKDKNENIFNSIKAKIKECIEQNYPKEVIDHFLFMNKYKDLNQIFKKFEISNMNDKLYCYKEIKVDNISIVTDVKSIKCECDLCIDDRACFKKVSELNKNVINVVNENNICFEKQSPEELHNICKKKLIEKANRLNIFHSNEEIFLKNITPKKVNYFSKSKIIFEEKPNIELNYISDKVQEKIPDVEPINSKEHLNNNNDSNIQEKKDVNNTKESIENGGITNKKEEVFIEYEEKEIKKSFKNISRDGPKNIKEKPEILDKGEKASQKPENEKRKEKNEEIEEKEKENEKEKEKEEVIEGESKKSKTDKNNKRGKSRKRYNKKREIANMLNENNEENENEEEKSCKKKKRSNSNIKKKNKSKFVEINQNEEKDELDKMLEGDIVENEKEKDNNDEGDGIISKKKKSKSPNRKKNKKH